MNPSAAGHNALSGEVSGESFVELSGLEVPTQYSGGLLEDSRYWL